MKLKAFLAILPMVIVVAGCSGEKPVTPEEKKAFLGGPMPADFQKSHPIPGPGSAPGGADPNATSPTTGG